MQPDITADQLRRHVQHLAGTIGERNVYRPQALHAAEDYIRETWRGQGYDVVPQEYTVVGVRSANLEITRRGTVQRSFWSVPTTIPSRAAPVPTTTPAALPRCWNCRAFLPTPRPRALCGLWPSSTRSRRSFCSGTWAACTTRARRASAATTFA
jgi:hypothetical protein